MSQRRRYAVLGLLLALGAPLGLMVVLLAEAPAAVSLARVEALVRSSPAVWIYVWGATSAVMCAAGAWAGAQEDRWRALSTRDALTGLPNRRAFDDALEGALDAVRRQGAAYALLAIDVDHLKQINDAGGHAAGDAAIRAVAEVMRRECRASGSKRRSSRTKVRSAVCRAASAPAPMATPNEAAAKAGVSFTPSPTTPTRPPAA